jgi:hypothetical protein
MREMHNAIAGFNELEMERDERFMRGVRLISFYAVAPHVDKKARIRKPEDLFDLPSDSKAKKERVKRLKPIQKIEVKKE